MSNQHPEPRPTDPSPRRGVGPTTATSAAERHYSTGLTRANIEQALRDAGKDPGGLSPTDLVPLEDFHSLGRPRPSS